MLGRAGEAACKRAQRDALRDVRFKAHMEEETSDAEEPPPTRLRRVDLDESRQKVPSDGRFASRDSSMELLGPATTAMMGDTDEMTFMTQPPAAAPAEAAYFDDEEEEEDDDTTGRPVELRRYIKSLSQRSLDYFGVLENRSYKHLECFRAKEKASSAPPLSAAAVLTQALHRNTHTNLKSLKEQRTASAPKLAFAKPFDTKMTHVFSTAPRFAAEGQRPTDVLMGPGEYAGPAVDPRSRSSAAKLNGKWTTAQVGEGDLLSAPGRGPGTYNPPISSTQRAIGEYDESMPSIFAGSVTVQTSLVHKGADVAPPLGSYEPCLPPTLSLQPRRRAGFFGAVTQKNGESERTLGQSSSTPAAVGPGAYRPGLPVDRQAPTTFMAGRPHVDRNPSVGIGPGSHNVGGNGLASHPSLTTTPAGKLGAAHSFASQPYIARPLQPEEKVAMLARSQTHAELLSFELSKKGRNLHAAERQEGFRARDERMTQAVKMREVKLAEFETNRHAVENKREVRKEMRAQRRRLVHRQLSFATIIQLGATAGLLGQRIDEMREIREIQKKRAWAASTIAKWWRRSVDFAARSQKRKETLGKKVIQQGLRGYIGRARLKAMNSAANVLLNYLEATHEAGFLSRATKEAISRVKMIQRVWRRLLAQREALLEMAIMQWEWYEPRRVVLSQKRKHAAAGSSGKVGFDESAGAQRPSSGAKRAGGIAGKGQSFSDSTGGHTPRGRPGSPASPAGMESIPQGSDKKKSRRKARASKADRVHPMKGQIQGPLVLDDSVKRSRLVTYVLHLEQYHRRKWRRYIGDVQDVKEQLRKQAEAEETLAAAKQLLLGTPMSTFVEKDFFKAKILQVAGPAPLRSPWLPEKDLCGLIDEALVESQSRSKRPTTPSRQGAMKNLPAKPSQPLLVPPSVLTRGASMASIPQPDPGSPGTRAPLSRGLTINLVQTRPASGWSSALEGAGVTSSGTPNSWNGKIAISPIRSPLFRTPQ